MTPNVSSLLNQSSAQAAVFRKPWLFRWLWNILAIVIVLIAPSLFWQTYTLQQSCEPFVGTPPISCMINGVTIEPQILEPLNVGKSKQLIARVELNPLEKGFQIKKTVSWQSSNPDVATVNAKGKVIAIAPGKTKITATSQEASNKQASLLVTIEPKALPTVTKVQLHLFAPDHYQGEQLLADQDFSVIIEGKGDFSEEFTLESDNPEVASVDTNQKSVTLQSRGSARITAVSTANSNKKSSIVIAVLPPKLEGITLQPSHVSLKINATQEMKAAFTGRGDFDRQVIWSSSDPDVAKVNADGVVTGRKKGNTSVQVASVISPEINTTIGVEVEKGPGIREIISGTTGVVCVVGATVLLAPPIASVPVCAGLATGVYRLLSD
ncbi:MAG: Ig-like domain-containing protein [Kaiparowitsia implicata GSE-PSE-MK54-09C]|jgi:uncharacterized protein YjdB|nr:Ig-like domain-containing protein [Kaiparowitsia implicata GSE-PSE-MK54-09C]